MDVVESEMADAIAAKDWSTTPLGPVSAWSPTLRTMVNFVLASRFPLLLWWGPEFVCLYNDAYIPVLGEKHPWALGRPVSEVWQEIWPTLQPLIETPFHGGPATWNDDITLDINRHGFLEETHFTIAYSPVPDEGAPGGIGGVMATVHEITDRIISDRRVLALRDLAARSTEARTAEDACVAAAHALTSHSADIPFALFYLIEPDRQRARLAGMTGISSQNNIPTVIGLECDGDSTEATADTWPLGEVLRLKRPIVVRDIGERLDLALQHPADQPHTAVVVPITSAKAHLLAGFVVAGCNPKLEVNDGYKDFLNLVASQISGSIANAREYEAEKERADALAEIDRAKSIFFSNVSHEFRTPLTLMLAPLEEVLGDATPMSEQGQRERVSIAHNNSLRLLTLVNNLLDFARIDAGNAKAAIRPTNLALLTANLVSTFGSSFESAGIELRTTFEAAGTFDVDVDMWETIVLNLVANALKYTLEGTVTVELHRRDALIDLAISDTGIGIAPQDKDRVFERFFRSQDKGVRSFEGSGIGLALVSELVRLHGGSIRVDSVLGSGSTFTVSIPALPSTSEPEVIETPTPVTRAFAADAERWVNDTGGRGLPRGTNEYPTILVVDDNSDMRRYLGSVLKDFGRVLLASTGREAINLAVHDHPDLIVSDVMMPDVDGLALVDLVRSDADLRDTPVLLLSGRAGAEATVDALDRGADDYLVKPFSAIELEARIRTLLGAGDRFSRATTTALLTRERAESIVQLSISLHSIKTLQDALDETFAWVKRVLGARLVTLSVVDYHDPMLRLYYAGATSSPSTVVRYFRTPLSGDTPAAQALRTDQILCFEDFDALAKAFPVTAADVQTSGLEALAVLPLHLADGRPFGALAICWNESRTFDPDFSSMLHEVAALVEAAAHRGQLIELEGSAVQRLEGSLLDIHSRSTAVIVRARHHGSDVGANIGGDWYDAIDITDGRIAVAVGDVVGHGLSATRTAARLRGALGLAALDMTNPTAALGVLDRFAATVQGAECTTVALAIVDPRRGVVSYACAGHPPPLLVSPTGEATYLEDGRSHPLGVDQTISRTRPGQQEFLPGSLLFLYTDGLVERRGESIEEGLGRLKSVVMEHWDLPLRHLKRRVFTHCLGQNADDDIALVAVRSVGSNGTVFSDAYPARHDQQQVARKRLRSWLDQNDIPDSRREEIVLAVGEALSNAIDHGSLEDPTQIVTIELARRGSELIASVSDRGYWQPGLEGDLTGRGRGHLLMETLADSVDIDLDVGGSVITLQFSFPGEAQT